MSLSAAVELCDTKAWRPRRAYRAQVKILRSRAPSDWSKHDITDWRALAELGWGEGMMILARTFDWPVMPLPSKRAVATARFPVSDRTTAGFVAKAVGSSMAIMFSELDEAQALRIARDLTDPEVFVDTIKSLLDDGVNRTGAGLPTLGENDPQGMRDIIWRETRDIVHEHMMKSPHSGREGHRMWLDLANSRSQYSPI